MAANPLSSYREGLLLEVRMKSVSLTDIVPDCFAADDPVLLDEVQEVEVVDQEMKKTDLVQKSIKRNSFICDICEATYTKFGLLNNHKERQA